MPKCNKVKNPCKICLGPVTQKNGLQCQGACQTWVHYGCLNYTPGKIKDIKNGIIAVTCPCPDCSSELPREYRTDATFSCTNLQCPANLQPKCNNDGCPINKDADNHEERLKKMYNFSNASTGSQNLYNTHVQNSSNSSTRQQYSNNASAGSAFDKCGKRCKDYPQLISGFGPPMNQGSGTHMMPGSGPSMRPNSGTGRPGARPPSSGGRGVPPKTSPCSPKVCKQLSASPSSSDEYAFQSGYTSQDETQIYRDHQGVTGDGGGALNSGPSLDALEQMCNTVGQLTNQINTLMKQMKHVVQEKNGSVSKKSRRSDPTSKTNIASSCYCPGNPGRK